MEVEVKVNIDGVEWSAALSGGGQIQITATFPWDPCSDHPLFDQIPMLGGVWATLGTWNQEEGRIEDAPGNIPEAAFEALDAALNEALSKTAKPCEAGLFERCNAENATKCECCGLWLCPRHRR